MEIAIFTQNNYKILCLSKIIIPIMEKNVKHCTALLSFREVLLKTLNREWYFSVSICICGLV
jgi:hypothetical protein